MKALEKIVHNFNLYINKNLTLKFIYCIYVKLLLRKKIILFNKLHPIYTDFFKQCHSNTYSFIFCNPKWLNTFIGKWIVQISYLIHSDAASFTNRYLTSGKKLIIECEGVAKNEWLSDNRVTHVIFQSKYAGRKQLHQKKASLIYPAFEPPIIKETRQSHSKEEIILLTVGYGSFIKGFDISFEIFLQLKERGYPVKLIIAGTFGHNFEYYPEVSREAYENAGFDRIVAYAQNNSDLIIKPFRRTELLESIYPSANIFLHFARMETFGFTILEAMGFGLPVISIKFKAIPEMIEHGVNGFLCNPFNWNGQDSIDESMMNTTQWKERCIEEGFQYAEDLVQNIHLREKLSRKALEKSIKFNLLNRFLKLASVYES